MRTHTAGLRRIPPQPRGILAEELGHVLLRHSLVDSTVPGRVMGLLKTRCVVFDREARALAAELLTPFGDRRRWFALLGAFSRGDRSVEDRVTRLADEFGVTRSAMRVWLQQMKLVP